MKQLETKFNFRSQTGLVFCHIPTTFQIIPWIQLLVFPVQTINIQIEHHYTEVNIHKFKKFNILTQQCAHYITVRKCRLKNMYNAKEVLHIPMEPYVESYDALARVVGWPRSEEKLSNRAFSSRSPSLVSSSCFFVAANSSFVVCNSSLVDSNSARVVWSSSWVD